MMPLKSISTLVAEGLIAPEKAAVLEKVAARYAVALTPAIVALIDRNDPADPVARAFVPSEAELVDAPEERLDPIGDAVHSPVSGIVHRHRDRALFEPVLACPAYCRFCFRRAEIGRGENALSAAATDRAIAYIAFHPEIREVILTGGDPFALSARRAGEISGRLAAIDHVKVVRWHTRVPITEPEHVNDAFVAALIVPGATTVVALHADHPRELYPEARDACARLIDAGIPMVSQTVLLKGVNDDIETLKTLMETLVEMRIKPYYLHHPDLAPGTGHFRVSVADGLALMRELKKRVSGLAVPHYVLDIPGGFAKVPLDSADVEKTDTGWRVRDHAGDWHEYP
jgi:lysine 2,3-aminomutase